MTGEKPEWVRAIKFHLQTARMEGTSITEGYIDVETDADGPLGDAPDLA